MRNLLSILVTNQPRHPSSQPTDIFQHTMTSATHSNQNIAQRAAVLNPAQRPQRRLRVAAGFYRDHAMAELVRRCLVDEHQLRPSQLTVLQPADLEPARYAWLAKRWTPLQPSTGSITHSPGSLTARLTVWLEKLAALLSTRRRFDAAVQRQLAAGDWAVLVHGVALAKQASVLNDLRQTGHCWCAEAPRLR